MSRIIIRKRVSLDFVGEDYKDCYIIFNTIPMKAYDDYVEMAKNSGKNGSTKFIKDVLEKLFISGEFIDIDNENKLFDIKKEELGDFDMNVMITMFRVLTGQDQDPK